MSAPTNSGPNACRVNFITADLGKDRSTTINIEILALSSSGPTNNEEHQCRSEGKSDPYAYWSARKKSFLRFAYSRVNK